MIYTLIYLVIYLNQITCISMSACRQTAFKLRPIDWNLFFFYSVGFESTLPSIIVPGVK